MVQATALLVAAFLTVTVSPALAVNCALVKRLAAKYSQYSESQLEQMARNYNLSEKEIAAARACLKDKK
jgi:hypothetical protein